MTDIVKRPWFNHGEARKVVAFYTEAFPDSKIMRTYLAPDDFPDGN